jgi:hypothetical protein
MKSYLSVIAVSVLILTGCASPNNESQPEYDAVELVEYQSCLDGYWQEFLKPTYRGSMGNSSIEMTKRVAGWCQHIKPVKK